MISTSPAPGSGVTSDTAVTLKVSKPTTMSLKLVALNSNGEQVNVRISFAMTW